MYDWFLGTFRICIIFLATDDKGGRPIPSIDGGNIENIVFLDIVEQDSKFISSTDGNMSIEWLAIQSLQIYWWFESVVS